MKTFSKFIPGLVLGLLVLDSAMLNAESQAQVLSSGAEVDARVAADVAEQLRAARAEPRAPRAPRVPAVEVIDPTWIVVEASRLPSEERLGGEIRTAQVGF